MSLNYTSYVNSLANLLELPVTDPAFLIVLPNIIDDAEQRVYRELDILNTVVRDPGGLMSANSRTITLPQTYGRFVVVESMKVFTPAAMPTTPNPMVPVSRELIEYVWPTDVAPFINSVPQYYAPVTDQQFVVGPAPDASYPFEVVGTIRPTPLSATNATTYLSLYLPDILIAASMVFAAGYQRNFGSGADDPQMGVTWELHLKTLLQSANIEEQRKRYASQAWTPKQPAPLATPPRT